MFNKVFANFGLMYKSTLHGNINDTKCIKKICTKTFYENIPEIEKRTKLIINERFNNFLEILLRMVNSESYQLMGEKIKTPEGIYLLLDAFNSATRYGTERVDFNFLAFVLKKALLRDNDSYEVLYSYALQIIGKLDKRLLSVILVKFFVEEKFISYESLDQAESIAKEFFQNIDLKDTPKIEDKILLFHLGVLENMSKAIMKGELKNKEIFGETINQEDICENKYSVLYSIMNFYDALNLRRHDITFIGKIIGVIYYSFIEPTYDHAIYLNNIDEVDTDDDMNFDTLML